MIPYFQNFLCWKIETMTIVKSICSEAVYNDLTIDTMLLMMF